MQFAGAILLLLLLVPCAEGQPPEATPPGGLAIEQILSKNGCGAFSGLVAATAGVGQVLRKQSEAGLAVFCPDDGAVAAFAPRFSNLSAGGQAALLLHHGLAARSGEVELWLTHRRGPIEVRTLDGGRWGHGVLSICYLGGAMQLASSPPSFTTPVEARVTSTVVYNDRLTVYLIDAVLVPGAVRLLGHLGDHLRHARAHDVSLGVVWCHLFVNEKIVPRRLQNLASRRLQNLGYSASRRRRHRSAPSSVALGPWRRSGSHSLPEGETAAAP
ncbi:hypothetical protein ACQJBY_008854 [Aegilops geniculata]